MKICFYFLLIIAFSSSSSLVAEPNDKIVDTAIHALYPAVTITDLAIDSSSGEATGRIKDFESEDTFFSLKSIPSKTTIENTWEFFLFKIIGTDSDDYSPQRYLRGAPMNPARFRDAIIAIERDSVTKTRVLTPDPDAPTMEIQSAIAGDLIGDGTIQIRLYTNTVYYLNQPLEVIGVGIDRILRASDFKELFSGMTYKSVLASADVMEYEIAPREFRLVPSKTGAIKDILETTRNQQEARFVFDGISYNHFVSQPAQRSADGTRRRAKLVQEGLVEKSFRIQVVTENEVPIVGASINGTSQVGNSWVDPEAVKVSDIHGKTDASGTFLFTSSGQVTLKVEAQSYLPSLHSMHATQPTPDVIKIVLKQAPMSVAMFPIEGGRFWFNEWWDAFEFGIRIKPTGGARTELLDDRTLADIWFSVYTADLYQNNSAAQKGSQLSRGKRSWNVAVAGQNGWQIAPGPENPNSKPDNPEMLFAPASGYSTELVYNQSSKIAFFLYNPESRRYGKMSGFRFTDKSQSGEAYYSVGFKGLVQMEDVGSNSLYPLSLVEQLLGAPSNLAGDIDRAEGPQNDPSLKDTLEKRKNRTRSLQVSQTSPAVGMDVHLAPPKQAELQSANNEDTQASDAGNRYRNAIAIVAFFVIIMTIVILVRQIRSRKINYDRKD